MNERMTHLVGRIGHLTLGSSPRPVISGEPDGFCIDLPVTSQRLYGGIHLVRAMAGKARQLQLPSAHDDGEPARNMSGPGYWRKVLSGAWDKTCRPLDWKAEKAAVVLVAVGTIILAGVHLGHAAMFASAIGYLWILAPLAFAALVLSFGGAFKRQQSCMQNSALRAARRLRNLRPLLRGTESRRPITRHGGT
jgi:hypothetical protein